VSAELLVSIFTPPAPLHDGAVVISGNQVSAAGCILPLSQNPRLAYALGTRHRAALGISEESDAIVLVVSEETSQISIAEGGRLLPNLDEGTLRSTLATLFATPSEPEEAEDEETNPEEAAVRS
jgi:diadenylate cyclase